MLLIYLNHFLISKNADDFSLHTSLINYLRNDEGALISINKTLASYIRILFQDQQIEFIDYLNAVQGKMPPEDEVPQNQRTLAGFNWRGDERIISKEGLFEGKPVPELTRIKGIEMPETPEEFFDEREEDDLLLDQNSRLKPEILKNRAKDSLKYKSEKVQDSLKKPIEEITKPVKDTLTGNQE